MHSAWHQRHAVMTPLFVETQASQTQVIHISRHTGSAGEFTGQVRATQDVQNFTATVAGGGKQPLLQ